MKDKPERESIHVASRGAMDSKLAEDRLREYEELVENLEEMIVMVGRDYRYLLANRAFLKYRGMQRDQVVGRAKAEILDRDVFDRVVKPKLDECFQGKVVRYELTYCFPDIGERVLAISYFPIESPTGVDRVACVSRDITEQKQAEELHRQSESQLANAQHLAHLGSWNWELKSNILTWSDELYSIFGVQPNEFTPSFEEFMSRLHPEDRDSIAQSIKDCLTNREPFSHYERILLNNGEVRVLHSSGNVVCDEQGQPLRMFGACQDITEQHRVAEALGKAEQKYRDIFENADEGIFQSTPEGQYIAANPALARMHGFDSPEELIQCRSDISQQIYVDPERRREFKRLLEQHGTVRGFELQTYRKDGSKIWVSVNARAVRDEQGTIRYYEGTAQDISERKQVEAALRKSEQELRLFNLATNDMFWNWDFATGKVVRSSGFERVFGYSESEIEPSINWWKERLHPDDNERVLSVFQAALEREGKACSYEYRFRRYDGSYAAISDRAYIVRDESGNAVHAMGAMTDITERKRAEEAMRDSEKRHRDIFDLAPVGIYQSRRDGTLITANNAMAEMLGYQSVDELLRINLARDVYLNPNDRERIIAELDEGLPGDLEIEWKKKDGSPLWVQVAAHTIAGPDNDFEGFVRDVSEQKRAEAALRESEERYRDLVENSHELICTHDLHGLVLSANPAAAAALGYDLDEFVGKKCIRDILAPEVRHQFDEYMARLLKDGATRGSMLVQTMTGETRIWEYYNSLRTEGVGAPVVRGMARDITEERRAQKALRESEERYRELFENAKDALYVHDLGGRYTSFNHAAEQLSGFTRDEIIGKHFSNFVAPGSLKDVRKNFCKKLDEESETTYEIDLVRKDRRRVPVEVSSRLIYENGKPIGVQGVARDITDRKRAQQALRTYSQRLIEAQEAERQVIARELHDEIGQVLTAVRINLQSLQRSDDKDSLLSPIDDSLVIVDEALDRVRELSLNLRPSLLDNLGLASALRWYVDRYARRSGIVADLKSDVEDGCRLRVELETACFRIVQEALTNVARHAQATHVSVRLTRVNGNLDLRISDNGVGFAVDELLNNSPSTSALGLRGMEERAVAVLGELRIDSSFMRGTEVSVLFPLRNGR